MTPQLSLSFSALDEDTLHDLSCESGPCLTLCLPARHPGASELPRSSVLLNLLRETESQIHADPDIPEDFLVPIRDLLKARNFNDGGEALAIFRTPDFLLLAQAHNIQKPSASLGPHFQIAPFLEEGASRREVYLLALNQKHLHFYIWANGKCIEFQLPSSVPKSLEAAMAFDIPEHNRENRSSASTSSDTDNTQPHLHDYFKQIDRGLKELLRLHPLLLAGVPQHTRLYRSLAEHAQVLDHDLPDDLPYLNLTEIGTRIQNMLLGHYRHQGLEVLAKHRELRDRSRAISAPDLIGNAAAEGRIHQFVCASEAANDPNNNAAISETLRHRGDVYLVPQSAMPNGHSSAAILRY